MWQCRASTETRAAVVCQLKSHRPCADLLPPSALSGRYAVRAALSSLRGDQLLRPSRPRELLGGAGAAEVAACAGSGGRQVPAGGGQRECERRLFTRPAVNTGLQAASATESIARAVRRNEKATSKGGPTPLESDQAKRTAPGHGRELL